MTDESAADTSTMSALRGMISFFTLWHMDITQRDMDSMERKFHMVPVVGLLFGIILTVELAIMSEMQLRLGLGSGFLYAMAVLLTVYVGSKFIHFDGLTDFGDGMIVSGQREDHVRALKDTLVGAGGIGVALTVTLTSVAVYSVGGPVALMVAAPLTEVLVKNAMVVAAAYGEPGNGMAGRQVSMTTIHSAVRSSVVSVVCSIVVLIVSGTVCSLVWDVTLQSLAKAWFCMTIFGIIMSWIVGRMMASVANRNFGMVNGDILGATNEICRPVVMMSMLIVFFMVI